MDKELGVDVVPAHGTTGGALEGLGLGAKESDVVVLLRLTSLSELHTAVLVDDGEAGGAVDGSLIVGLEDADVEETPGAEAFVLNVMHEEVKVTLLASTAWIGGRVDDGQHGHACRSCSEDGRDEHDTRNCVDFWEDW